MQQEERTTEPPSTEMFLVGAFITAFYIGYVLANIAGGILTDVLGGRATLTLALLPLGVLTFCSASRIPCGPALPSSSRWAWLPARTIRPA